MDLLDYLRPLTTEGLEDFAVKVGTTVGHVRNVAYRQRTASAALAMQIEIQSGGTVSRRDLRPRDYMLIWPDIRPNEDAVAAAGDAIPELATEASNAG